MDLEWFPKTEILEWVSKQHRPSTPSSERFSGFRMFMVGHLKLGFLFQPTTDHRRVMGGSVISKMKGRQTSELALKSEHFLSLTHTIVQEFLHFHSLPWHFEVDSVYVVFLLRPFGLSIRVHSNLSIFYQSHSGWKFKLQRRTLRCRQDYVTPIFSKITRALLGLCNQENGSAIRHGWKSPVCERIPHDQEEELLRSTGKWYLADFANNSRTRCNSTSSFMVWSMIKFRTCFCSQLLVNCTEPRKQKIHDWHTLRIKVWNFACQIP